MQKDNWLGLENILFKVEKFKKKIKIIFVNF